MSTVQIWETDSTSSDATEKLGEQLGKRLRGGEVIEFMSDLGGGKTTFVRGLVRGAGSRDSVGSPTFTISKVYKTEKFEIHHFDFYRLQEAGLIEHELADVLGDPEVVVLVEWGGVVQGSLPEERLTISLKPTDETTRHITVRYPENLTYTVAD